MWITILGFAIIVALNPVSLALILLLLSRSRPLESLFAYWAGAMVTNVTTTLIPLMMLHWIPAFGNFTQKLNPATNSTGGYVQLVLGVLVLVIAALIVMQAWAQRRKDYVTVADGPPNTIREVGREEPAGLAASVPLIEGLAAKGGDRIRRVVDRIYAVWESDALWVAFVLGLVTFLGPVEILYIDTAIVASGNSILEQIAVGIVFVLGAFAIFEIALIGYLLAPEKAQAVVRPIHDWARAYRRQIVVAMLLVVGVAQVVIGLRGL